MADMNLTIHELHETLISGEASSVELTRGLIDNIRRLDPDLNSFITVTEEEALSSAEDADRRIKAGDDVDPLLGIPYAVKDIICTKGIRTTCASKILEDFVPPYDATVIKRLKSLGAVLLGKTNLDEFAMGSSTETSFYGTTHNPWDVSFSPGGSSGGSAAAVAANECVFSLGTDTGGSIRLPASFCGVVGLRPTYGRVSRYGLVHFSSSMDAIGPITKDVEDCALVMNAISGWDRVDVTCARLDVPDYIQLIKAPRKKLTVGISDDFLDFQIGNRIVEVDVNIRETFLSLVERLRDYAQFESVNVEKHKLEYLGYTIPTYQLLCSSEASSNLARYDGTIYGHRSYGSYTDPVEMMIKTRGEGFGKEVKRRIMIGTYYLSAGFQDEYFTRAQKVRTLIRRDLEKVLSRCDVLVAPTTAQEAFKIGSLSDDPVKMHLTDICVAPAGLAGIPSITVPGGFSNGLPIGFQIMGNQFDEGTVMQVAYAIEQVVREKEDIESHFAEKVDGV